MSFPGSSESNETLLIYIHDRASAMAAPWLSPSDILACRWALCSASLQWPPWDEAEVQHSQPRSLPEPGLAAVLILAPY